MPSLLSPREPRPRLLRQLRRTGRPVTAHDKGRTTVTSPSVHHGDALAWLQSLDTASVDAVITDPPYSSGGMVRSDRANTSTKVK